MFPTINWRFLNLKTGELSETFSFTVFVDLTLEGIKKLCIDDLDQSIQDEIENYTILLEL